MKGGAFSQPSRNTLSMYTLAAGSGNLSTRGALPSMKPFLTALVVLCALTSCGTADESTPSANVNIEAVDSGAAFGDDEMVDTVYLTVLRNEYPANFIPVPDSDLIALGEMICDSFDDGMTFMQGGLTAMESGYSAEAGGFLIGASVTAYCPEHEAMLP